MHVCLQIKSLHNLCVYVLVVYMLCTKYGFGQSTDWPAQTVDLGNNPWSDYAIHGPSNEVSRLWIDTVIHECVKPAQTPQAVEPWQEFRQVLVLADL